MTYSFSTQTPVDVPFFDVDSMDIVWHGHYVKYLEVARCEFLDALGHNYRAMRDSGYAWPIVDMRIKYVKPLVFGQKAIVKCSLKEWEYRLKLSYRVECPETQEKLTEAYTVQVPVLMATGEMSFETPEVFRQVLARACAAGGESDQ